MATPEGIYPFATQDGKSIPLDIINPDALVIQSFTSGANTQVDAISDLDIAVFIASSPCIVMFDTEIPIPAVNGTKYPLTLLVPKGVTVTVQCPAESFYVRGLDEAGTLYVQLVKRWAGLALPLQFSRK